MVAYPNGSDVTAHRAGIDFRVGIRRCAVYLHAVLGASMDALKKLWHGWQRFGRFIGNLVGRVVLSLFYFTILLPFGLGATLFGDTLGLKNTSGSHWKDRTSPIPDLDAARRQF